LNSSINSDQNAIVKQQILLSAQTSNILPITSVCNVRCLFCSHKQNPPEVKTYYIRHRSLEEIEETLDFIAPDKRIVIGESVTKINEGEPFAHPLIEEVLRAIRRRFPSTKIQITTNGSYCTKEKVDFLKDLGGVELNYSLNSCSLDIREKLMKDSTAEISISGLKYLKERSIPFHGSLVAMPSVTGWEDLEQTIKYFDKWGAETIRVFTPGFTRLAPPKLRLDTQTERAIEEFIRKIKLEIKTPITLEPQQLTDLKAVVEGVIHGSPAYHSGVIHSDIILTVNGEKVFSRVEAFNKILELVNPRLAIQRGGQEQVLTITKSAYQSSGLVMAYDLAWDTIGMINGEIKRKKAHKVVVLTSNLAFPILKQSLEINNLSANIEIKVVSVENNFFGGSIRAAGLLVVDDFLKALEQIDLTSIDLILLPAITFDNRGADLTGKSYLEIEEKVNREVSIL